MYHKTNKKKLRIAVDIDGVLADQVSKVLEKLNKEYNINLKKEDIDKWDYPLENGKNIEEEINRALLDEEYVLKLPLIDGAKECLEKLSYHHQIIIASSRPEKTKKQTKKWLNYNFGITDFICTIDTGKGCLETDILIDDNIENIIDFSGNGKKGILFSQPWNKKINKIKKLLNQDKVIICKNWFDIIARIDVIHN